MFNYNTRKKLNSRGFNLEALIGGDATPAGDLPETTSDLTNGELDGDEPAPDHDMTDLASEDFDNDLLPTDGDDDALPGETSEDDLNTDETDVTVTTDGDGDTEVDVDGDEVVDLDDGEVNDADVGVVDEEIPEVDVNLDVSEEKPEEEKTSATERYKAPATTTFGKIERLCDLCEFMSYNTQQNVVNGTRGVSREALRFGYKVGLLQQVPYFVKNENMFLGYANGKVRLETMQIEIGTEAILSKIKESFAAIKNKVLGKATSLKDETADKVKELKSKEAELTSKLSKMDESVLEQPKKVIPYAKIALCITAAIAAAGVAWYIIANWKAIVSGDERVVKTLTTMWDKVPVIGKEARHNRKIKKGVLNIAFNSKFKKWSQGIAKQVEKPTALGWTKAKIGTILKSLGKVWNFVSKAPTGLWNVLKGFFSKPVEETTASNKTTKKEAFGDDGSETTEAPTFSQKFKWTYKLFTFVSQTIGFVIQVAAITLASVGAMIISMKMMEKAGL